jgi:tetratricopeptide (TPR) repeat protein
MNKLLKSASVLAITVIFAATAFAKPHPKPVSSVPEAQKYIDRAWELENTGASQAIYKQCIELMEKANKADPENPMVLVDLARYHWSYGDELPKETEQQQEKLEDIYEQGLEYAERSLELKETPAAHYWTAVNLAASKEFSSIFSQAAAFPSIYGHSEDVKKLDPDYDYGAPGRLWSEVLTRVPKTVVEMVGWDVNEAVDEINTAIAKHPKYIENYEYKARFYYNYFEDKEEALKILEKGISIDPASMPEAETANRTSLKKCKSLWKKITGKEYPQK